ncbi:MAG: hypothetical protein AAF849_15735 [Bacteroidota bacterium]
MNCNTTNNGEEKPVSHPATSVESTKENTTTSDTIKIPKNKTKISPSIQRKYSFGDYQFELNTKGKNLEISTKTPSGKSIEGLEIDLEGTLKKVAVTDMNQDERPEFVVISASAAGDKAKVYCFTPHSAMLVYLADDNLEQFQGESEFDVKSNQLIQTYRTKKGVKAKVSYNLVAGEAAYRLEPHGMSLEEIKERVYGTFASKNQLKKLEQQLIIRDNGLGEIVVEINAIDVSDKTQVCNFKGIGKLVDGQIRVRLSSQNKNLEGELLLRSLENGWNIALKGAQYQSDLRQLCDEGTILGDYYRLK